MLLYGLCRSKDVECFVRIFFPSLSQEQGDLSPKGFKKKKEDDIKIFLATGEERY